MIKALTRFVAVDEAAGVKLGKLLSRLAENVPREPGNLAYDVFAVTGDQKSFFCLESWNSQYDFDGHLRRNEATGVSAEAADLLAAAPETRFVTAIDPINDY